MQVTTERDALEEERDSLLEEVEELEKGRSYVEEGKEGYFELVRVRFLLSCSIQLPTSRGSLCLMLRSVHRFRNRLQRHWRTCEITKRLLKMRKQS